MVTYLLDYWKILTLSREPYTRVKSSESGFSYSVGFFLVLALILSLGSLIGLRDIGDRPNLAESIGQLSARVQSTADKLPDFLSQPLDDVASTLGNISKSITQLQAPLGRNLSQAIRLVGGWLGTPLNLLSAWLGAALGIWLVALLMGGQATLRQHLSLFLLAFAPQVLTFFKYLPDPTGLPGWLTNFFWWAAMIWSLVIAVHALSIAHEVDKSRAFLLIVVSAVVFFAVIPFLLAMIAGVILSLVF